MSAEDAALPIRPATRRSTAVTVALIALKAFALGASGSISAQAALVESVLDLIGGSGQRWGARRPDAARARAVAGLVQAGLILGVSGLLAWAALTRMVLPRVVEGGVWAPLALLAALAVTVAVAFYERRSWLALPLAELGAGAVAFIGAASGALLNAPGLDAAAALVIAVWLAWGGVSLMRASARPLLDPAAAGPWSTRA